MPQPIKLGLLGNGIGRSRAGKLHEMLGELYGIDVSYRLIDLAERRQPVSIREELLRCRDEGFRGVNVTHPYKRDAFTEVQAVEGFPRGLTAVNTVVFEDGGMLGDNTDCSGFVRAFRRQFGAPFRAGRVLMLGAGGVGVAIAIALTALGADELVIYDKEPALSGSLRRTLDALGMAAREPEGDLCDEMLNADGLVNATPVGMFQYPGNPFPKAGFGPQRWAFDAVYTPENTEFMRSCRSRGIETLSGFRLFLFQGLDAFRRFTGVEADAGVVEPLFLQRHPLDPAA